MRAHVLLTICRDHPVTVRWAHAADPSALLCSSEDSVLTTLTLTNAEAYHNLVYRLMDQGVPVKAVCIEATFLGEVDASTVKHRLDVLNELQLPVYITGLSITGLDPAKHAYELEKFLRIAFSHNCIAGIYLGALWDRPAKPDGTGAISSGLYASNKQAKPAAGRLDHLWREEWQTNAQRPLGGDGVAEFEGYYGTYNYHLESVDGKTCTGSIQLAEPEDSIANQWGLRGADGDAQEYVINCEWEGHLHVPVWTTPAVLAATFVLCLWTCYRKRASLSNKGKVKHTRLRQQPES
jgi:hypothetical protein